jgi:hypothetical protein
MEPFILSEEYNLHFNYVVAAPASRGGPYIFIGILLLSEPVAVGLGVTMTNCTVVLYHVV